MAIAGGCSPKAVRGPDGMERIKTKLTEAVERIRSTKSRIANLSDRLISPPRDPEVATSRCEPVIAAGELGMIEDLANEVSRALSALEDEVSNLTNSDWFNG